MTMVWLELKTYVMELATSWGEGTVFRAQFRSPRNDSDDDDDN